MVAIFPKMPTVPMRGRRTLRKIFENKNSSAQISR